LLRSFELLASEILHLQGNEHEKIWFDCKNFRAMRIEELQTAARVAAEQVRRTSEPYRFGPMSSRERRIVHLALREEKDLRTESDGEGGRRSVVVYPGELQDDGSGAAGTAADFVGQIAWLSCAPAGRPGQCDVSLTSFFSFAQFARQLVSRHLTARKNRDSKSARVRKYFCWNAPTRRFFCASMRFVS
jgi:hypothetical protein